jgi:hypothetical protein
MPLSIPEVYKRKHLTRKKEKKKQTNKQKNKTKQNQENRQNYATMGTQKPQSNDTKYERTKLKYPPMPFPSPQNTYFFVPSINTKRGKSTPSSK